MPDTDRRKGRPFLPPRWFIRLAWYTHRGLYRITGGRFGLRRARPGKWGMMRLTATGRRTGQQRSVMLAYLEDGPNLYTLAMNGWGDPEPAWWLNLQANPEATVDLPGGRRTVTGRAAEGDERSRLWAQLRETDKKLDEYAALRSRETAVVVLEPR
jgi:deazaflavin-dependent oxidoreductase (nitroreductase family)